MKVEVDALGSPSLTVLMVSAGVKQLSLKLSLEYPGIVAGNISGTLSRTITGTVFSNYINYGSG